MEGAVTLNKKANHKTYVLAAFASICSTAVAGVVSYECNQRPDDGPGWRVLQNWCDPALWIENGWFYQHVELCAGHPPPGGQQASYSRDLNAFSGVPGFFLEWVVESDAPRTEIPWGGGAALAIGNDNSISYVFYIAADQVKLNRDDTLPTIIFVDLQPDVAHVFRLELFGPDLYIWYIDGQIVDSGVPEGPFPGGTNPVITWRAKASWVANTTRWDYIRFGTIPPGEPGDLNCDGAVNVFDIDPFIVALSDPDAYAQQFPACSRDTADLDGDGHVDFFDIDPFVNCVVAGCP
jgi:hypothetical protein